MKTGTVKGIPLLMFCIFLVMLILLSKLFFVQIRDTEIYVQKADRQYVVPISSSFDRGAIFFSQRSGENVSAATLKTGFSVAIDPRKIDNAQVLYKSINEIIEIDEEVFMARASKTDDPYELILRRVDKNTVKLIEELDDPTIIISEEKWRYYPGDRMASQTLGFVGYDGDELNGRYGLERYYNDVLKRTNETVYVNFFAEVFSNIKETLSTEYESNRDGDIVTTIDIAVQGYLEEELRLLKEKWNGDLVGGIVMDPMTGEIVALANAPDFNPNSFNTENDLTIFGNPLVENVYEMGSIIKALTMGAGLDSGAVTALSTYDDKGYLILDNLRIQNYDGRGRGVVNMQEVLNQSLNTGVAYVVTQMGKDMFKQYMLAYGLGDITGIDLPHEVSGLVKNLNSTRDIEYATASYGQGIAMSPMATIRALASLGNGGILINPHLVKEINYTVGFSHKVVPDEGKRILKPETSEEITRMLVHVVDNALLNGDVKMDGYSIAAKTGTAQMASPEGGYYEDKFLHSFFGYFPAYNPEFIVFLYIKDPKDARYASQTLTHPFINITKFLLSYYEIPPDR